MYSIEKLAIKSRASRRVFPSKKFSLPQNDEFSKSKKEEQFQLLENSPRFHRD